MLGAIGTFCYVVRWLILTAMKSSFVLSLSLLVCMPALCGDKAERSTEEKICAASPSVLAGTVGAIGGGAAATAGLGQVFGMTLVAHSSGAYILTGSGGYIAGTLVAASTPILIVGTAAIASAAAAGVELWCVPKNHPEGYKMVMSKAKELQGRAGSLASHTESQVTKASSTAYSFTATKVTEWKDAAKDW